MYDGHPHPLLAQIPLTVSPFISLPTATTLPYTYKSLPSTLPPSSTGDSDKAKYVVSASGHAAHPDEIIASCKALQEHLQKLQDDAEKTVKEWEDGIKERDLAEKRRLAPGWLDREEKILEPEKKRDGVAVASNSDHGNNIMDMDEQPGRSRVEGMIDLPSSTEGEELDRAFGRMGLRPIS
ncbi:MAG: hypothetical protein FRX48_04834 [Lasallia pustulata]|uniref:Uncharacterized protein n=2 Tax=Lasallia pustulata TaxID=136370 RepID=A0A5M8PPY6_9LECA|nr:MAG: hypothetical protein FRX48_04834 [Lasallia pustulata]